MRNVPAALQAHLDSGMTTTCRLLKITLKSGAVHGITTLDQDVTYDDGAGSVTYIASNGFDPSMLQVAADYSVDNAEAQALLSNATGITEEMVNAGELNDAAWVCYLVNYRDLSMGHVMLGFGDLGEVRLQHGILWLPELLSIMARLKKPIGFSDSVLCRAVYGSPTGATYPASQTGCGVDTDPLWVAGGVTAVGAETNRTFTGDAVATLPEASYPGRIEWLTGDNAGRVLGTESVSGLVVTLGETTLYPVQVGDTYRHRRDCRKRFVEDCITLNSNGPEFKGEPHIPLSDGAPLLIPGAEKRSGFVARPGFVGEDP